MKKLNTGNTKKTDKKSNNNNILLIAVAAVLCIAVIIVSVTQQKRDDVSSDTVSAETSDPVSDAITDETAEDKTDDSDVQVIAEGESLIIPVSDVSSTVSFYPVEEDGTQMEVRKACLAVSAVG